MYTVKTSADHFLLLHSTDVISLHCTLSLSGLQKQLLLAGAG